MEPTEKLRLLKALRLLDRVPEDKLASLAEFLVPETFQDGQVVFEEGSPGDSLYFISKGHIRISKKVVDEQGKHALKDLAILGPGDCMGEMALIDQTAPRSAQATASGDTILFKLGRAILEKWLQSNPTLALGFFAQMVQVLSKRLRRSSNELTLLFDLSQWLLEPFAAGKELLQKVLAHVVPHLEGSWSAGAYLYNEFNAEMDLVHSEREFKEPAPPDLRTLEEHKIAWPDAKTVLVALPGKKRLLGYLLFQAPRDVPPEEQNEVARTLKTAAGLVSAVENIQFRTEDALRARLKSSVQRYGSPF